MESKRRFNSKILKILIIPVVLVLAVSVLLRFNVFIDTDYETSLPKSELDVIYSQVIENNRKKFENAADYGDKFCVAYISTKDDLELDTQILAQLKELSDTICDGAENDYEKVKRIAYWVADNIYYNFVASESEVNPDTISLETVLELKATTCAGYSNMFSALCNMQDLYCVNMRGGTYIVSDSAEYLMTAPINHEWNAVMADGKWVYVDTTWMSGNAYYENGYSHVDLINENYFDMTFEEMSHEHRIDLVDHRDFKSAINALK